MASLLSIYFDIAQKHGRFTPLPRIPDHRLPVAGDTVTYRYLGEQYTGFVFAVADYFDCPAYNVFHPVRGSVMISGGQVIGIAQERLVA